MTTDDQFAIYARDGNLAVVHLPGRRFPGLAIQGDTLHTLVREAEEVAVALQTCTASPDLIEEMDDLVGRLRAMQAFYEAALGDRGIELPYAPADPA